MRRLTALLGKELRQHAAVGIALIGCLAGAYLLMLLGTMMGAETVSLIEAHAAFLFFLTLSAIVLGNRLIVTEYYGRTQLFVEALPMARWELVALKYLLGLAFLLLAGSLSLMVTTVAALSREAIDIRFLTIVAVRTGSWILFAWSFFFAIGFIGRFRIPVYCAIVFALAVIDQMTALELQRFGPFAVLDNKTLPFEREVLPTDAVIETVALGTGLTALAFLLALIHEGSVAETLAKRMSQREKALIGILVIALMLALTFLEERREKAPYAFPEEEVVASETLPLEVLYLVPERRDDAGALLGRLEGDLGSLARSLDWPATPAARVAYSSSLDAGIYDRAELAANDGILVRANFAAADFDPRDFSAHIAGLMLDEATRGRAQFEPKAWLRDGFTRLWSHRGREDDGGPEPATASPDHPESKPLEAACWDDSMPLRVPLLRALWTTRAESIAAGQLAAWRRYRQRHGEDLAEAVAFSGLLVLEQSHGRDAVLNLAREVFAREPHEDLRELIHEWRYPMAVVFERATATHWLEFITTWNSELERLRDSPSCRQVLASIPEGTGSLDVETGEGAVRDIIYRFHFVRTPPPGTLVTLLHRRLTPFDQELKRRDLRRVEKLWPAATRETSWHLPGFYNQGSRAFLALEVESKLLDCPIRLHAERRVFK